MSFTSIYKPGQGKWTRVMTAVGFGVIVLASVWWIWNEMQTLQNQYRQFFQGITAVALVGGFALLFWWLLNKPKIADFMIATEAEMRKVNWPSKKEILGSTVIVIGGTFIMAAFLWVVDLGFGQLFIWMDVLKVR